MTITNTKTIDQINGIKVGDLITAYHSGYWRVIGIEQVLIDKDYRTRINYELEYDSNFKPTGKKKKQQHCDSTYCKVVDEKFFQSKFQEKIDELQKLYNFARKSLQKSNPQYWPTIPLLSSQIEFARQKVGEWLTVGGNTRTSADADHSALLYRLLSGKKALPKPPPVRMSYPWYELGEGNKIELDPKWDNLVEVNGIKVSLGSSGPFGWHDKRKGILVYPPSGELFRLFEEGGKRFIQKVQS